MEDDWALFREWTRGDGDLDRYLEDLGRPGALTAALNWYRAGSHPRLDLRSRPPFPSVGVPVLGIWSSGDNYLSEASMQRSEAYAEGGWRYERVEGASHWVPLDQPARLNELLVEFLG